MLSAPFATPPTLKAANCIEPKHLHASVATPTPARQERRSDLLRAGLQGRRNQRQWIRQRLLHHLAHDLFDQAAIGQAQRVELDLVLLDGFVFLGGALVGPDIQITQQF